MHTHKIEDSMAAAGVCGVCVIFPKIFYMEII